MWYVYFLELANGDVYVGSTNDLRRRVASHQQGQVISTRGNLPALLRSYLAVESEPQARRLEHYFKSGSGKAVCGEATVGKNAVGSVDCLVRRALLRGFRSAPRQPTLGSLRRRFHQVRHGIWLTNHRSAPS